MARNCTSDNQQMQYRFGIGEWYGKSMVALSPDERAAYAALQSAPDGASPVCPFKTAPCWKKGGVCSLRRFQRNKSTGQVSIDERGSTFRTICPTRFEQDQEIYRWIGEIILGDPAAVAVGQVNFLERVPLIGGAGVEGAKTPREVGRIDNVLVIPNSAPLEWCAVEIQAVYFSGKSMGLHFREIRDGKPGILPFPGHTRRPDYRSSAPKRLMPQLQIKVPTLSTWGKKMAVVVDEDFFNAMGTMETVADISNCHVAWFVVRYVENGTDVRLQRSHVALTKLDKAVDGLIAGKPPTKDRFEAKIRARVGRGE